MNNFHYAYPSVNKISQVIPRLLGTACLLLLGLFFSSISKAQTTPANCTQGCTSNDVQIISAYLSNSAGVRLPSNFVCPPSGTASVYLTLELTTNTPRKGVAIYANIKLLDGNGDPTGSPIATLGECFGTDLNQPTNKVTFQSPFNWQCGTAIALTDVFIAWGTGNKNFCTGSAFQCPATPSKCYQLPGGSFIAIETPVPQNQTVRQCSDAAGGTTSTFNLNNVTVTNSANVTITWWENYTAPSTFSNQIASPGSYSSASKDVYAKITSNADNTVFSVSTVTLVVHQTPNLVITDPAAVCSPNTVDITAGAVTAGSTLTNVPSLSYWTNSDGTGAVADATAVGNGTYYIKALTNTNPACSDIKAVVVTVYTTPAAPTADVTQPTCAVATGTIEVTSPLGTGITYSINGTDYQSSTTFINVVPATYNVTAKENGCPSSATSKTVNAQPGTPAAPAADVTQPTCTVATGTIVVTSPLGDGITYSINGTDYQSSTTFNNVAPGNYNVTSKANGCTSSATSKTVNAQPGTPDAPTATLTQPTCAVATGTIEVTAPLGAGITYSINGTDYQASTTFENVTPGNYNVTAKANGCTSSATSKTVNPQPTTPATPTVCIVQPSLCGPATGTVTITSPAPAANVSFSIDNGATWQSSNVFNNVAAGSVTGIKVKNAAPLDAGCISDAANCDDSNCEPAGISNPSARLIFDNVTDETTIKAFPNPFSDRVKFLVTSSVAGRGNIEVYNMMGQKVKTVYEGFISAGTQTFELSLPTHQISSLVYVLRIGDKKMTGKILQINQ